MTLRRFVFATCFFILVSSGHGLAQATDLQKNGDLIQAVMNGNLASVQTLLNEGASPDATVLEAVS
jgi:hypothetical protein